MPFKSDAQRKYMNAAANRGELSKSMVDEFNQASKGMKLPKKVGEKRYVSGTALRKKHGVRCAKRIK